MGRFSRGKLSWAIQSPCPGLTDLYPLLVSMETICPGWLELKWKHWITWGLAEPWVVKRSNRVLCKQGPKLWHFSLWMLSSRVYASVNGSSSTFHSSTDSSQNLQNLLESRNSGGIKRIPAAFLSIPCTFNRNSTLQRTDKSYTKKITI